MSAVELLLTSEVPAVYCVFDARSVFIPLTADESLIDCMHVNPGRTTALNMYM